MLIVIAAISLVVSITMSAVAWRLARKEHRRSRARVAVLASDLADLDLPPAAAGAPVADLFRAREPGPSRFAAVLAVGVFAVAMALTLIVVTGRNGHPGTEPRTAVTVRPGATGPGPRTTAESAPLELVALGHEREGDGIIVRGIVRNPMAGVERDRVAVVVFLFNRDGGFLTSSLATVDVPALAPGSQSGFIVTVPHASEVGRYRVSFRCDDRVVPHVDRRDRGPMAQLQ